MHRDNTSCHVHAVVVIDSYIFSKNTYKKVIRDGLSMFKGFGLDIQGIRNLSHAYKYIIKEVKSINDVILHNQRWKDVLKKANIKDLLVVEDMSKFDTLETWYKHRVTNINTYVTTKNKCITIWEVSRNINILRLAQARKKHSHITYKGLPFVLHLDAILFLFKFSCLGFSPHVWKRSNILIAGKPNCGKSSFFKLIENYLNIKLFWCSSRPGDFSNWNNGSFIIIDDIIRKGTIWPMSALLKCLGREGFTGDAKIRHMLNIPSGVPVVICTNFPKYFIKREPVQVRLINCWIMYKYDWLRLKEENFLGILIFFKDIALSDNKDLDMKKYHYVSSIDTNPLFKHYIEGILTNKVITNPHKIDLLLIDRDFNFFCNIYKNLNKTHYPETANWPAIFMDELIEYLSWTKTVKWGREEEQ